MARNFLKNIWENPKFKFYGLIVSCFASGGGFVFWLLNNQMQYLKDRNDDLGKNYELNRELDRKICESQQAEMRINVEMSLSNSYKKLKKGSKEAELFMEAYEIIHGGKEK